MGRANPIPTRGPIVRTELPRFTVSTLHGGTQTWGYNETSVRQLDTGNTGSQLLSGEVGPTFSLPSSSLGTRWQWGPLVCGPVLTGLFLTHLLLWGTWRGRRRLHSLSPVWRSALNVNMLSTCHAHLRDQRWAPLHICGGPHRKTGQEHGEPHSWAG